MGMRLFERFKLLPIPPETQSQAPPTSDVQIGTDALPDPNMIPLADHRRILEDALLARDRTWLKKLKVVEASVMWPWQGPVTTLIRATEREIEEKARRLHGGAC